MQFITNINLLHVSAPDCHPQVVFQVKELQVQDANSSFLRFLDHTQQHTTIGRTPLDEWSACHRELYL